jgi:hypothetical protein
MFGSTIIDETGKAIGVVSVDKEALFLAVLRPLEQAAAASGCTRSTAAPASSSRGSNV